MKGHHPPPSLLFLLLCSSSVRVNICIGEKFCCCFIHILLNEWKKATNEQTIARASELHWIMSTIIIERSRQYCPVSIDYAKMFMGDWDRFNSMRQLFIYTLQLFLFPFKNIHIHTDRRTHIDYRCSITLLPLFLCFSHSRYVSSCSTRAKNDSYYHMSLLSPFLIHLIRDRHWWRYSFIQFKYLSMIE